MDAPRHWEPGENIGRYTLLARIAIGGMAEIWLARQMGLKGFEKVVVIKRISDNYCTDPLFVEMFLDEARIAAQLDHPNIVQIHDLGQHAGAYYIAMEYLHGEDLATTVRGSVNAQELLPYAFAAQIIARAAEGLASAHNKSGMDGKPLGVVHRDVSPQNIFVTYEGVVKMVDFGVAKAANRVSSTSGGQLKGKFSYMAPEQARGDDIDARADVWSLGVVLFETVTRTRLFDPKMESLKLLKAVASDEKVVAARERNPDVPAELEAIIAKALERDVKHRYQSAIDFRTALEKWLRTVHEAPSTTDIANYMRKLFGERMGRKAALIESARSGEIKFFRVPEALKPDTERSMPGETVLVSGFKRKLSDKLKWPIVGGAGLLALGIVAGVAWKMSRTVPPSIYVGSQPSGARIEVDGIEVGHTPYNSDAMTNGRHVVVAFLDDGRMQTKTVSLNDGQHEDVMLEFPSAPEPAPAPEKQPAPDKQPGAIVPSEPVVKAADPTPTPAPVKAPEPVARGKISVETNPWTKVIWNGRALGETPLIQVPLPAGKQKLKLVNEEKGINKTVEVTIQAGKTTVLRPDVSH
jgi:serine/threonine-protein kinase